MHYFLQGERGIGKSYLLLQVLAPFQDNITGFAVQRLIVNDQIMGFAVRNVKNGFPTLEIKVAGPDEETFLYHGNRNLAVLEQMMAQVEADSRADSCKLVLLDEIGGVELKSVPFMSSLKRILAGPKPCIGVFKSNANLIHMARRHNLDPEYLRLHQELEDQLTASGQLITLTKANRTTCALELSQYLSGIFDNERNG